MDESTTLLYVDDEPTNLLLFELNFKKKYKVITAESGSEALSKLENNQDIIIVISDMKMPGMNGIEFISKAKIKYKHIAYFILTGFDITNEIEDALNGKLIQKYFSKPLNINDINSAIQETISNIKRGI